MGLPGPRESPPVASGPRGRGDLDTHSAGLEGTAAVRVTAHTGEVTVTEPRLIRRWEWHEVTDLPVLAQPLFTPSAHVIDTVWPGLLPGLPPIERYPLASTAVPEPRQQAERAAPLRHAMADRLLADGRMDTGGALEAAFRRVPRHRFLPGVALAEAYDADRSPVTKRAPGGTATSSVSAPWLQADMLRAAVLHPGDTVIEIGSGGYNAALVQEVVGPHGTVFSVDIDPFVTDRAHRFLTDTGYHQVRVHLGDGNTAPAHLTAPGHVDAIIVTVEAHDIPPAWIGQLAEGGRLVVPLRIHGYTWSIPFTKRDGVLVADTYTVESTAMRANPSRWVACADSYHSRAPATARTTSPGCAAARSPGVRRPRTRAARRRAGPDHGRPRRRLERPRDARARPEVQGAPNTE